MKLHTLGRIAASATVLVVGAPSLLADGPTVLGTGERGGALTPCEACPADAATGGMARLATVLARERAAGPVLLVDAGNAFFGGAQDPSGRAVRALYDALGYDVVNVSWRDFRHGLDATRALFAAAAFTPVSCNLLDGDGAPLFDPWTTKEVAGRTVAVVGLSARPPGLDYLPHLKAQLAGVIVADPSSALEDVLPRARAAADAVLLLCYGDRELVDSVRADFGPQVDAIVAAGVADGPSKGGAPPCALPPPKGAGLVRLVVGGDAPQELELGVEVAPDPDVAAKLESELLPIVPPVTADASRVLPSGTVITAEPLELDARSADSGFGSGLALRVTSAARRARWQGLDPPAGTSWMVIALSVENDIPASLAFGGQRDAGETLLVTARQKLFLVCGAGARTVVAAAAPDRPTAAEALLPERFTLDFVGDERAGEVAFAVPDDAFAAGPLRVRLEHDEVGTAVVDVRGSVPEETLAAVAENGYAELASPVVAYPESVSGREPPPGARWVLVTVLGRSLASGPAFWLEGSSHLELLVDGQWARRAEPGLGTLPREPVLLPERFTGGTAAFLAPLEARSLELSCAFPALRLASGEELVPTLVRLPLEGTPVEPAPEHAAVVIEDGPLAVAVLGVERCRERGPFRAAEDRTLLVLDARVENRGPDGFLDLQRRFLADDLAPRGVLGAADLGLETPFLVPAGARRAFRVVLDAPREPGARIELTYAGVSARPSFELDVPSEGGTTAATHGPPESELGEAAAVSLDPVWRARALAVGAQRFAPTFGPVDGAAASGSAGGVTVEARALRLATEIEHLRSSDDEMLLELEVAVRVAPDAAPFELESIFGALWGVVDGARAVPPKRLYRSGELPTNLLIPPGEEARGTVVFELSRAAFDTFSVELVTGERPGVHALALGADVPPREPVAVRANEAFRVALMGYEAGGRIGDVAADEGEAFVVADVRITSVLAGEARPAGLLAWDHVRERVLLVVDGLWPFSPLERPPTDLPRDVVALPTTTVGGRFAFAIPAALLASAKAVELVCGFEPAERPGGGLVLPEAVRFPLHGERPLIVPPTDGRELADLDATVFVRPFERPDAFHGRAPGAGFGWFVAELWTFAPAERGLAVDPLQRFVVVDGTGEPARIDSISWSAPSASRRGDPFWIPPGGVRAIRAGFRLRDDAVAGAALVCRGLTRVGVVPLDESSPVAAADPSRASNGLVVVDESREPRGLAGAGVDPADVNRAIDRGRDFLWRSLQERMREGELTGARNDWPVLLALVHCGAQEEYPELGGAMRRFLRRAEFHRMPTYELGIAAMILDALREPEFDRLLDGVLLALVESQGPEGSWTYSPVLADRLVTGGGGDAGRAGRDATLEIVGGEPPGVSGDDVARTQAWASNRDGDNSVSQFAVLGLATAERFGKSVDPETWRLSLASFTVRQELYGKLAGGWGYGAGTPYGSMTCAGICSTAISLRRLDPSADPRRDLRVRDGLAWLSENWTLAENPHRNDWHYYYLYGLERVGRILDLEFIGEHEWYPEGARFLVGAQKGDGSWSGEGSESEPDLATSFALLFLTRATESLQLEEPVEEPSGPGALVTSVELPAGADDVYVILDASGSMLSEIGGRRKFDLARDAVKRLVAELPDGTRVAVRVYGHRKRAIEEGAAEDTELLVPFAPLDREALGATLDALRPRGKTPLTLSLERALSDVQAGSRGRATVVVLLTDGGEDTRRDPIAAARAWDGNRSVELNVVGLDIGRPEWTQELRAIAAAAGGRYVQVDDAGALAAEVVASAVPAPPRFEVLDAAGKRVGGGSFGDELELAPGEYTLSFVVVGRASAEGFWVHPGRATRAKLDLRP